MKNSFTLFVNRLPTKSVRHNGVRKRSQKPPAHQTEDAIDSHVVVNVRRRNPRLVDLILKSPAWARWRYTGRLAGTEQKGKQRTRTRAKYPKCRDHAVGSQEQAAQRRPRASGGKTVISVENHRVEGARRWFIAPPPARPYIGQSPQPPEPASDPLPRTTAGLPDCHVPPLSSENMAAAPVGLRCSPYRRWTVRSIPLPQKCASIHRSTGPFHEKGFGRRVRRT